MYDCVEMLYGATKKYKTTPVLEKFRQTVASIQILFTVRNVLYENTFVGEVWEASSNCFSHYRRVSIFTLLLTIGRLQKVGETRYFFWSTCLVQHFICFLRTCRTAVMLFKSDRARLTKVCYSVVTRLLQDFIHKLLLPFVVLPVPVLARKNNTPQIRNRIKFRRAR